jgi:type II secretory pathway pseudopilin PulG
MKLNNKGYTIAESIVAIILLGIVSASVYSLFTGVQRIQRQAIYLDSATRAAQFQIESLRNANYNLLTPGEDIDFTDELPDNLLEPRSGVVQIEESFSEPGLRSVVVTVNYNDGGQDKQVSLSSYIGVIGIAQ